MESLRLLSCFWAINYVSTFLDNTYIVLIDIILSLKAFKI